MEHAQNQTDRNGGPHGADADADRGENQRTGVNTGTHQVPIGDSPPRPLWPTIVAGLVWAGVIAFLFVIAMQRS